MFTIIGGDGREYGPVAVAQIRAWMAAGRANLDTKAKAVGTDEWRRLGDFAEFGTPEGVPPTIEASVVDTEGDAATDAEPAERLTRLAAWFLDNVIAFTVCLPGFMLIGFSVIMALLRGGTEVGDLTAGRTLLGWMLLLAGGLILLVIQVYLLTTRGQTLGKWALGIRIVRVVDGGNPGFISAVLLRLIVPGIIGMIPLLGLGFLFSLVDVCFIFRADRRCIHDLMAGTRVVKVAP
ncbi:RDD family protein [Opitutus sp. ER46]|uniref:RDD family protein n=1 Tax=Opitutus sp. ER46 TaxID=2161864 RepID=UPI000D32805C|nr:RDD family protein [Opitutus sp. ER46]PTX95583.1 hypothetical protein DB354_09195 [Opitutus sp. ER46]